ncbi:hypothetical protein [Nocardiopsis sp. JB363]|uniref:hypothetical protein n=1 Tax=Nocardiopsis sp. JB363 TaxID=1434837 RepID=UPI00097A80FA|nr:hypothetical protein [Nocardiopsis sp. JB363]SIO86167.1 hypothetical protein BQ8420_10630 [Nocardiopsis sp. JB363]
MGHLKRFKDWLDSPLPNSTTREVEARTQERVAKLREEMAAMEVECERRGYTKRNPFYLREVDRINDEIDFELQRGVYRP